MNKKAFLSVLCFLLTVTLLGLIRDEGGADDSDSAGLREPVLAGTWYPGDKNTLRRTVSNYLDSVSPPSLEGRLIAIIVPHAGHVYSGRVAAYAYKLIEDQPFDRVIMIGPSHRFGFKGVSVNLQSGYRTPLGTVQVDQDLAREIMEASPDIRWVPQAHAAEHSLEIQIPFLQTVLKDFKIVPIVMGQQDLRTCTELADTLTRLIDRSGRTLLLASTDLSHFHDYPKALKLDSVFADYVKAKDPAGLARAIASGQCEACGGGPAITVMMTALNLQADQSVILHYANSGDVTGDHRRVVGYLSAALIRTGE